MDDRACDLWGVHRSSQVTFEDLSANIHPADRDRVRAAFAATRAVVGAYEIDFRIMLGDQIRWISTRGQGDDVGMRDRMMFGIFLDVTGRKQAEEANELLAGEMSHRVKNLLHVASALTEITSRSATTAAGMARDLTHRLTALGRAHDLVRPLPGQKNAAALLGDLFAVLLTPSSSLPTTIWETFAGESASLCRRWPSERRQPQHWPSSSTSWRPTRSNLAHSQRQAECSTYRAPIIRATKWSSLGPSEVGRPLWLRRRL